MTMYVSCDLSVDTVTLNWYYIHNMNVQTWKYNPADREEQLDSFSKFMPDGVIVSYIPGRSQVSVSFSASRVASGFNCFEYTNNEYGIVKEKIETAVCQATGMHLPFEKGVISRLDVYRSFVFSDMKDCKVFVKWLQDQPIIGKYKREAYSDNGEWRWFKSGLVLKAYIKNEDPHLPQEVRDALPPTVRLEIESKKGFRRKLVGRSITADILKYPALWVDYYNTALEKFKLNGTLVSKRSLLKIIEQISRAEQPNIRQTTITKRINAVDRFLHGEMNMRAEAVKTMNKLHEKGICPFPLSTPERVKHLTLSAGVVMTVAEQQQQERWQDRIRKAQSFYRSCIECKLEEKLCEQSITYTCYMFTISLGQYHLVPIRDSS